MRRSARQSVINFFATAGLKAKFSRNSLTLTVFKVAAKKSFQKGMTKFHSTCVLLI